MWNYIKAPFVWIGNVWNKFETWLANIAPGVKTQTITALGAVGTAAAMGQEFITGLPTSTFITAENIMIVNTILFALAFWGRRLAKLADA